jgi:muramoyltetrapeptide carboxypeptidase
MATIQFPPPLQSGDTLQVVAPSGTLRGRELDAFSAGLEIWRQQGYRVELGSNWDAGSGYLAGSDAIRRQALAEAWQNPESKGILCVRGGYGSARLLENWQWKPIHPPKWVIGFSDVTGLLWSLFKVGISGVHAPVLTTIAKEPDWSKKRLFDLLKGKPLDALQGKGWGGGKVTGVLLPANLTVATHLLATPICPSFEGVILALEDVQEAPYKIDRLLTQWRMTGLLEKLNGIALGRFSGCDAPPGIPSWSIEEVLSDRLANLNIPIVSELPFGHDGVNAALPVGQIVELDGDRGILSCYL